MTIMSTSKQWFAIRTKPHKEEVAAKNFERQRFTHYLPLSETIRRHARKTEVVRRPFFPGYLFLHLAPDERHWSMIGSTIGALGAVRFGDEYPPVSEWVISTLKARENERGVIAVCGVGGRLFKPGDRVNVLLTAEGEMSQAIFLAHRSEDRAMVLLDILRRGVQAMVPLAKLQAG